jgi:hypothetical protein
LRGWIFLNQVYSWNISKYKYTHASNVRKQYILCCPSDLSRSSLCGGHTSTLHTAHCTLHTTFLLSGIRKGMVIYWAKLTAHKGYCKWQIWRPNLNLFTQFNSMLQMNLYNLRAISKTAAINTSRQITLLYCG